MNFLYDPYLVLYLPLWQPDGIALTSRDAYGHLCTVTGALWTPAGRSLDGIDDRLSVPANPVFDFGTGDFTIVSWVMPSAAFTGPMEAHRIISHGCVNNTEGAWAWGAGKHTAWGAGPNMNLALRSGGAVRDLSSNVGTFLPNTFYHLAITRQAGNLYFYEDAASLGSAVCNYSLSPNTRVDIGCRESTGPVFIEFWKGKQGEILIYKRALAQPELQQHYQATKWRYRK